MRLGYSPGYRVPKCPRCLRYMHDPVEGGHTFGWVFYHCDNYWLVEYDNDKKIERVSDTVTGKSCYRCNGTGAYLAMDVTGEYEVFICHVTLSALPELTKEGIDG